MSKTENEPSVLERELKDDGVFPNSKLKPLVYRNAVILPKEDPAATFEQLFAANKWRGSWRDGIYPYHHYHSTAHEVLGVYQGSAEVQLGGEQGTHYLVPLWLPPLAVFALATVLCWLLFSKARPAVPPLVGAVVAIAFIVHWTAVSAVWFLPRLLFRLLQIEYAPQKS